MRPIMCIVGTRPNYMKVAPILHAFAAHKPAIEHLFVHTGQHYDPSMERVFFDALDLRAPDANLAAGPGSHAVQTGEIMKRLDAACDQMRPAAMLVVGDVNSTLAAALVAAKRGTPVIHVEAGLRSGDRTMPEEINRIVTDQLSDLLFTTERAASDNLAREGIAAERIEFVGNVMIDTLERFRDRCVPAEAVLQQAGASEPGRWLERGYALVTLHRPSNVDDPDALRELLATLDEISHTLPLVFPIHPRTRGNIERFGLPAPNPSRWLLAPPLGYLEMLGLMRDAKVVLTDSGGVQEETTVLGTPCLTLRPNTERPITITQGTNRLVGTDRTAVLDAFDEVMRTGGARGRKPELWDGRASERIAAAIWNRRDQLEL